MLPSKFISALVTLVGCVVALLLGSFVASSGMFGFYILVLAMVGILFGVANNFPMLLALALWFPFGVPVTFMRGLPITPLILMVVVGVALVRVAMTRSLRYVPSITPVLLLCFLWVPVRYAINPVHKLGAQISGGSGVSGLSGYFIYISTLALITLAGLVINSREKVVMTMIWSRRICWWLSVLCIIAAVSPTGFYIYLWLGGFNAGAISGQVERIVLLPGFGLFLLGASLSPRLFRRGEIRSTLLFFYSLGTIVLGGNRSGFIAAVVMVLPLMLLNRRFFLAAIVFGSLGAATVVATLTIEDMDLTQMPGYARILGVFSSRIDQAEGGDASAEWRYRVWESGIDKIKESPWIGYGFGHLPQHLDTSKLAQLTPSEADFEVILAMGLSHNGFINASYGFGLPFMICLASILIYRTAKHAWTAIAIGQRDPPLREFHAFVASYSMANFILIYTALDLGGASIWFYISMGIIMFRVTRFAPDESLAEPAPQPALPALVPAPTSLTEPGAVR